MKPSVAFYSTIEWVAELTNNIFSFGYNRHPGVPHFLLYPMFFTGELATYVIGYPLGVLAGGIAASVVFFVNLFKTKGHQVPNSPALTPAAPTPIVESVSAEVSTPIAAAVVSTPVVRPIPALAVPTPTPSNEQIKATVQLKKIKEQQTSLKTKNQLLQTYIDQKTISLSAECQVYDANKEQILTLKNRLAAEENKQCYATKQDGYRMEKKKEISVYHRYHYPNMPPIYITKETMIPKIVPDYEARTTAAGQCVLLTQQLKELSMIAPPAAYQARGTLRDLQQRLKQLPHTARTDVDLSVQHAAYLTILNDVASVVSNDPRFKVNHFKPTSQRATCAYVSFWVKRLPETETLKLPEELKNYIVSFAAPDLSLRDAEDIYQTCP